jgi:hypothetical protein
MIKKSKRVTIRKNPDLNKIEMERARGFNALPVDEKWSRLIRLIILSRSMTNKIGRKPNKITLTKEGVIYNN